MLIFNYETLIDPLLKDMRRYISQFSGMKAGDRILDVCCGTGAQVLEYGKFGVIATGVDINPRMLTVAERNKIKQKMTNVDFQLADAINLPFPNNYFDYASVSLGLHDKQKIVRYQIISEMKRVVKQDGALLLIDFQVPLPKNVWALLAKTIEYFAGESHYKAFKDYYRNDGLRDILHRYELREECSSSLKAGLLVILKVANYPG
jgi:ubiquinone/menaquinone biosynthesis C-methylase UbiE